MRKKMLLFTTILCLIILHSFDGNTSYKPLDSSTDILSEQDIETILQKKPVSEIIYVWEDHICEFRPGPEDYKQLPHLKEVVGFDKIEPLSFDNEISDNNPLPACEIEEIALLEKNSDAVFIGEFSGIISDEPIQVAAAPVAAYYLGSLAVTGLRVLGESLLKMILPAASGCATGFFTVKALFPTREKETSPMVNATISAGASTALTLGQNTPKAVKVAGGGTVGAVILCGEIAYNN